MKLTEEKLKVKATELAELIYTRGDCAEEKKASAANYRKRLDVMDVRIEKLAWVVRTGMMPEEERQLKFVELGENRIEHEAAMDELP